MVGLQDIADVAQLVERRLPKPRRGAFAGIGGNRCSWVVADDAPANQAVFGARCGLRGFSSARRSGVFVASTVVR